MDLQSSIHFMGRSETCNPREDDPRPAIRGRIQFNLGLNRLDRETRRDPAGHSY